MAQITFNIGDTILARIVAAYVSYYNYALNKEPSETEGAFTKRMIKEQIKGVVFSVEEPVATQTAGDDAKDDIDNNVIIT